MATGGIFQLITNDGRQDRMLMATALLNSRSTLSLKLGSVIISFMGSSLSDYQDRPHIAQISRREKEMAANLAI